MKICNVEYCNRKHEARGYCKNHYKSFMKYGNPLYVDEMKKLEEEKRLKKKIEKQNKNKQYSTKGTCNIDGCTSPIKAKLMCDMHYSRKRRNGTIETTRKKIVVENGKCLVIGCNNSHRRNGLCTTHLSYERLYGTPYLFKIIKQCGVKGCDGEHLAKGLCNKHYREWSIIKDEYGLE